MKIIESLAHWSSRVEFVTVSEKEVPTWMVWGHVSAATYYRLFGIELLPHELKTVLYLDSDIIINENIIELFNTDISDYALAAVTDTSVDKDMTLKKKLCMDETTKYFNAGVILLNLERWRIEKIGLRALQFCISNRQLLTYWDQCALNHVVKGRFYCLDDKWNCQFHSMWRVSPYRFHRGALTQVSSAAIIHFTGPSKPWHYLCDHPLKDLYFTYLKYTAWRDFTQSDRTLRNMVRKFLWVNIPSIAAQADAMYLVGKRIVLCIRAWLSKR